MPFLQTDFQDSPAIKKLPAGIPCPAVFQFDLAYLT